MRVVRAIAVVVIVTAAVIVVVRGKVDIGIAVVVAEPAEIIIVAIVRRCLPGGSFGRLGGRRLLGLLLGGGRGRLGGPASGEQPATAAANGEG